MSDLLDRAIKEARKLSSREQDALGEIILEEIADEARWAEKFGQTPWVLEALADEALVELAAAQPS